VQLKLLHGIVNVTISIRYQTLKSETKRESMVIT
jgi:hypothetical protein